MTGAANRRRGAELCACGCGETCKPGNRYINGHNKRMNFPPKFCECGCGELVPRRSRFVSGHRQRINDRPSHFASKVLEPDSSGCLRWGGCFDGCGYGMFWVGGHHVRAHRYSYELAFGPIPSGLVLDHLCRNRWCVNPHHLEPVTPAVNTLRGFGFAAVNARKTHCINGHAFTPENTIDRPDGHRRCRACKNASARAARRRESS